MTAPNRRWPQFTLRTILLLTTIMGVIFVACAKWPVTEVVKTAPVGFTLSGGSGGGSYASGTIIMPAAIITRPPSTTEWAIRAGVSAILLSAGFVLVGLLLARIRNLPGFRVFRRPPDN